MFLSRLEYGAPVALHELTAGESRIGRDPNWCNVVVPDDYGAVGRRHARITCDDSSTCWIENIHDNGTWVNGEPLAPQERRALRSGDLISLAGGPLDQPARCTFRFTGERPVLRRSRPTDSPDGGEGVTVLMLQANPVDTAPIRLDEESRRIDQAIYAATHRDMVRLRTAAATRIADLHQALLRHAPGIVHFSGHGSATGSILLCDEAGLAVPVPPAALTDLFKIMNPAVGCVVLNACYTRAQGRAIAAHVPCVVGMRRAVEDRAAILFAEAFYRTLAFGRPVRQAFDFGVSALKLNGIRGQESVPVLLADPGVAERLRFVS